MKLKHEPSEPEFNDDDEYEFVPCPKCDGHPACEDFGCAFKLGKGNMVNKNNGREFTND